MPKTEPEIKPETKPENKSWFNLSKTEPEPVTTTPLIRFSQSIFGKKVNEIALREITGNYYETIRNKTYNFGDYYDPVNNKFLTRQMSNKSNRGFIASLELILQKSTQYIYSYFINVLQKAYDESPNKNIEIGQQLFSKTPAAMDVKRFMEMFMNIFKLCDLKGIVIFNIKNNTSDSGYYLEPLTEDTPHIFNIDGKVVLGLGKLTEGIIENVEYLYTKIQNNAPVEIHCESEKQEAELAKEELRQGLLISEIVNYIKEGDIKIEKIKKYQTQLEEFPVNMADTKELQNKLRSIIDELKTKTRKA